MRKETTQIKAMMRSPKAMMDFQSRGKLPDAQQPSSELIKFLEGIPPCERIKMVNVRLSPMLGYKSYAKFANAQVMLKYLKPSPWVVGSWPAGSRQIKGFRKKITKAIFDEAQEGKHG